ncbi:MAG TPA: GH116 family glycosyl-hydrolase, partial [Abditibacteriaceae bacterium]|nr:GH116 family glycosyl-hydrolase [Abditibacteriaceae bacterium]
RFRNCAFEAAYPLAQVVLSDPEVPLQARLQAFNPFIPGDADASGRPVALLRWEFFNPTKETVQASVCATLPNFIGNNGLETSARGNRNEWRQDGEVCGIFASSRGVPQDSEAQGTMALLTANAPGISYRTDWPQLSWGNTILDFWDDFSDDGALQEHNSNDGSGDESSTRTPPFSLCVPLEVPPGESRSVSFVLAWHFPNRPTWTPDDGQPRFMRDGAMESGPPLIGNFYTTQWQNAWDAALDSWQSWPDAEAKTVQFARALYESDLPDVVLEAAGFNLSTLRSQTCFRTPDGYFFGWEGTFNHHGSCFGSCTHVWNYETATPHLFGELARRMRDIEFGFSTRDDGFMSFRVGLPLQHAQKWQTAAADGQMGCLVKLWREWKLCGDDQWLRGLWPHAKLVLEWCWVEGGWDTDRDGVMEGCQHNTMDVEYYGPNGQMQGWYLGALRATEEMARHLGDDSFAEECRRIYESGRAWTDAHLWNGEFYEQQIRPPQIGQPIARGLGGSGEPEKLQDPDLQLGAACLVDQMAGQYLAHTAGLGHVLQVENVREALQSVYKFNFVPNLWNHFNPMRSFALQDEAATLMATYPRGQRPARPFPYFNEVMTGFEYCAAVGMLQEGLREEGLELMAAIRARYEGQRRNPFDEAECGHHYARAMASWSAVLALTGFSWDASAGTMSFLLAPEDATWFWSNGAVWGTFRQSSTRSSNGAIEGELKVLHGSLPLRRLSLTSSLVSHPVATAEFTTKQTLGAGDSVSLVLHRVLDLGEDNL